MSDIQKGILTLTIVLLALAGSFAILHQPIGDEGVTLNCYKMAEEAQTVILQKNQILDSFVRQDLILVDGEYKTGYFWLDMTQGISYACEVID